MKRIFATLFLCLATACLMADTVSNLVVKSAPFAQLSSEEQQILHSYLLEQISAVTATPGQLLTSASAFQALNPFQQQVVQTYLLSQIQSMGGGAVYPLDASVTVFTNSNGTFGLSATGTGGATNGIQMLNGTGTNTWLTNMSIINPKLLVLGSDGVNSNTISSTSQFNDLKFSAGGPSVDLDITNSVAKTSDLWQFGGGNFTITAVGNIAAAGWGVAAATGAGDLANGNFNFDASGNMNFAGVLTGNGRGLTNYSTTNLVGIIQTNSVVGAPTVGYVPAIGANGYLAWAPNGGGSGTGIQTNGGTGIGNGFTNAYFENTTNFGITYSGNATTPGTVCGVDYGYLSGANFNGGGVFGTSIMAGNYSGVTGIYLSILNADGSGSFANNAIHWDTAGNFVANSISPASYLLSGGTSNAFENLNPSSERTFQVNTNGGVWFGTNNQASIDWAGKLTAPALAFTTNTVTTGNGTVTIDFSTNTFAYLKTNANVTIQLTGIDWNKVNQYVLMVSNSAASGTIALTPTFILMTNGYPASAVLLTNLDAKHQVGIISINAMNSATNGVFANFFMP